MYISSIYYRALYVVYLLSILVYCIFFIALYMRKTFMVCLQLMALGGYQTPSQF